MHKHLSRFLTVSCTFLIVSACGGKTDKDKSPAQGSEIPKTAEMAAGPEMGTTAPVPDKPVEPKAVPGDTAKKEMKKLGDFVEAWTSRYNKNEAAINAFEGMPVMELVTPAITLAIGPQFDLLNGSMADGRFEGQLVLAGKKGFIEKKGSALTFGYTHTLEKDGFGPTSKKGDVQTLNGSADLTQGTILFRQWTERGGKKITATQTEYRLLPDGSMICLSLNGHSIDGKGDPSKFSNFIFLHNGAGKYDFVVGKAELGPEFPSVTMAEKGDLDRTKAAALAKASGYAVEKIGGIVDGKLVLEK